MKPAYTIIPCPGPWRLIGVMLIGTRVITTSTPIVALQIADGKVIDVVTLDGSTLDENSAIEVPGDGLCAQGSWYDDVAEFAQFIGGLLRQEREAAQTTPAKASADHVLA